MLTLIHRAQSRSSRFIWLLEEIGEPYEIRRVTIRTGDGKGELDPNNPHPHGKVPALEHDGKLVFESPAIALYLTDAFPKAGLGPVVGDNTRGAYVSWLAYYGSVFEPAFVSKFMNVTPPRGTAGWVAVEEVMPFMIETLSKQPFLTGATFTAADLLFSSTFKMFGASPMMPKSEVITDYINRCYDRPALARSAAKD